MTLGMLALGYSRLGYLSLLLGTSLPLRRDLSRMT